MTCEVIKFFKIGKRQNISDTSDNMNVNCYSTIAYYNILKMALKRAHYII